MLQSLMALRVNRNLSVHSGMLFADTTVAVTMIFRGACRQSKVRLGKTIPAVKVRLGP